MKITFKDFGDALKETTETKTTVTHKKFGKYNVYFNNIILTTKNKTENAIIVRDGEFLRQISGLKREVEVPPHLIKDSVVIHNHPSGTSFSKEDIVSGIEYSADKLIVFHPNTYIYEAEFKNLTIEKFEKLYAIIELEVDVYLNDAISKGASAVVASFEKQHYIFSEFTRRNNDFNYRRYRY